MTNERFDQRLLDLRSANARFREAVERWQREDDDMVRDSMIERFEFTFELAWKTARDWMRIWERDIEPNGPRQVFEAAFARGVIGDANRWSMLMLYRNRTVHIYGEDEVEKIAEWLGGNALELFDALIGRVARDG